MKEREKNEKKMKQTNLARCPANICNVYDSCHPSKPLSSFAMNRTNKQRETFFSFIG